MPEVRISIVPRAPSRSTLPPPVRAAKMLKTVRMIAAKMARRLPRHIDLEDLVGAGALGLADAFSRRNGMPGSEFEAFASYRVRGAMLDELRRLDAMPRRSRARAKQVEQAHRTVERRSGTAARDEDVAKELGLALPAYQEMRAELEASRGPIHLAPASGEEGDMIQEIADPKNEAPDEILSRSELGALIVEGINTLPERMRRVLVGLYVEGETLRDIGASLGVSESRACQIHSEALAILRANLAEDAPPVSGEFRRGAARAPSQVRPPVRRLKSA
jgi:RNA polymerase sigma factor for flagellar operon FliA